MSNFSSVRKFKYLLPFVFGSFFISPCSSTPVISSDTSQVKVKDIIRHNVPDSVLFNKRNFKAEELIRGERLFYGLAYLKNVSVNCAACHNTSVTDTLNWNPDAIEIS